jgi:hypothetical protein
LGGGLTIFGWGMGEHDGHLLQRLKKSRLNRVACSVFGRDQAYCTRADQMIRDALGQNIEIVFFDSATAGWL